VATLYPNGGALILAGNVKTLLAGSILKLYKAISSPLSVSTVIGDFTEADYDGYVAKTITAWLNAYLDPAGGASIQSGTQQFDFVAGAGTMNNVLGFYLTTAAGALFFAGSFPAPVPMNVNGDSIPLNLVLNYGAQG
jgi:hypothetical protein